MVSVGEVQRALATKSSSLSELAVKGGAFDQPNDAPAALIDAENGQVSGFCSDGNLFEVSVFDSDSAAQQKAASTPKIPGHPARAFATRNLFVYDSCQPPNNAAERIVRALS